MTPAASDTLYVGNLSWNTDDDLLYSVFSAYNPVSAVVSRHADSGRSKGWGLVTLPAGSDLESCIQALDNTEIDGRSIICRQDRGKTEPRAPGNPKPARAPRQVTPNTSVYFGGLAWATTTDELLGLVSGFNHVSAEVRYDRNGRSRGYGIVQTNSIQDAETLINQFNGTEFGGRTMVVRFDGGI